ncbi:sulfotransferase [Marinobacter daepoensis]|uniref:Sulfotransferase n=1 Tax=Marinobacter daepoensis TaxID=262077 RepID=A0ABS3BI43_9GAMM|nr:sulfotransferase [Marinobacter daepoensis]MBN7770571.1 sulfotransferase [Marinobacter daepoensis]MBY6080513.1 sulfotransferase [Marinobacter daepoensis]
MTDAPAPLNILVAGIYWSGSGAVVDYLKGHPDCAVPRGEFTDFKRNGRIGSMLEAPTAQRAKWLARSLWAETRLGKLPGSQLKALRGAPPASLPLKEQVGHHRLKLAYLSQYRRHLARGGSQADSTHWNQWLQAVGKAQVGGKRAIVWNQPIWVGKHEHTWPAVFSPYKLVVVHRDPVDQFAEVVRQGKIGKRKSDPAFDDSEKDDILYVLKGLKAKLLSLEALSRHLGPERILLINFEHFVEETPAQAERLCGFLGLPQAQEAGAPFDPSKSILNVGIGRDEAVQRMLAPHQSLINELCELRALLGNEQ